MLGCPTGSVTWRLAPANPHGEDRNDHPQVEHGEEGEPIIVCAAGGVGGGQPSPGTKVAI